MKVHKKWIGAAVIAIAAIWIGLAALGRLVERGLNQDRRTASAVIANVPNSDDLKIYWDAPPFSFLDQDGQRVTDHDLHGHVWVADFIFTQCTTACPILTSKLLLLQKKVQSPSARFISFSVDPEHDSPAALKQYAQLWQGDESRWRLLSTDAYGLKKVSLGMKVTVAKSDDKDNPILHTTLLMLMDQQGQVRGIYDSSDPDAINHLADDMHTLIGSEAEAPTVAATSDSPVTRGHVLFGSMGCLACHSQPRIAPPVQSLFGSQVRLDDGRTVWADEAYLHESIVDPYSKVVAGYSKTMPNYHSYLSDQQVLNLVDYLESISANPPGGHGVVMVPSTQSAPSELLVDPVCKMHITKDPTAPQATFEGHSYFFCSDHCRDQFLKNPEKYTLTKIPSE